MELALLLPLFLLASNALASLGAFLIARRLAQGVVIKTMCLLPPFGLLASGAFISLGIVTPDEGVGVIALSIALFGAALLRMSLATWPASAEHLDETFR